MEFSRAKRPQKPRQPLDEAGLHEYALKLLGQQMRTMADLRRKLRTRAEPGEQGAAQVQAVLERLHAYKLVDDSAFAENFVQMRQQNQKHGPRRLRNDLATKGVDRELAARTVEARFADVDEVQLAREHLERKRIQKPEDARQTARVMRRLAAAGFSARTIHAVLRQWNVALEAEVEEPDGEASDWELPETGEDQDL